MCFIRELFFHKCVFFDFFLHFFRKWISYSKYELQGIVKVFISYQVKKTAMFYLQKCDLWKHFYKMTKILSFSKKTQKLCIVSTNSHEWTSLRITFYISVPNFRHSICKIGRKLLCFPENFLIFDIVFETSMIFIFFLISKKREVKNY